MSEPVRAPSTPAPKRARYQIAEGALTHEELALLDERDPVDPAAVIAWLEGEGSDPWQPGGSSTG